MLTLTEEGGLLTINYGGELFMTRRIELTLPALTTADEETRGNFLERIVLEVQRSLDHFERQFRTLPLTKLLLGPLPEPLGMQAALQSGLEVRVETFDVAAVLDCERAPVLSDAAIQNRLLHCLGAALRLEESRL
jgi:MSHA biogenesis protein MshI